MDISLKQIEREQGARARALFPDIFIEVLRARLHRDAALLNEDEYGGVNHRGSDAFQDEYQDAIWEPRFQDMGETVANIAKQIALGAANVYDDHLWVPPEDR